MSVYQWMLGTSAICSLLTGNDGESCCCSRAALFSTNQTPMTITKIEVLASGTVLGPMIHGSFLIRAHCQRTLDANIIFV